MQMRSQFGFMICSFSEIDGSSRRSRGHKCSVCNIRALGNNCKDDAVGTVLFAAFFAAKRTIPTASFLRFHVDKCSLFPYNHKSAKHCKCDDGTMRSVHHYREPAVVAVSCPSRFPEGRALRREVRRPRYHGQVLDGVPMSGCFFAAIWVVPRLDLRSYRPGGL